MKMLTWVKLLWAFVGVTGWAQTPVVSVTNIVMTVSEPNGLADFVIIKDSGPEITVNFEMLGSAILGADYLVVGGARSVTAGGTAGIATVRIQVLDDFSNEVEKTIILHLLPGPGYIVGEPSSAMITLRSDDPSPLPPPEVELTPTLVWGANPPIVAPNVPLNFRIYAPGTSAWVFVDSFPLGRLTPTYGYGGYRFQQNVTNATPGLHVFRAAIMQTNGASQIAGQAFRVADAIIPASSQGTIANAALVSVDAYRIFTRTGDDPLTSGAYMEFAVPKAATNWKSALFMTTSGGAVHQLFSYDGDGRVTTNDVSADAELVAASNLSGDSPQLQFDVTRWTQAGAGDYVGFKLQIDATSQSGSSVSFENIFLGFFSETNDVPAHFSWLNYPTNLVFADDPLVFNFEVFDPDSRITGVRLFEQPRSGTNLTQITIVEKVVDLPPGRNFVTLESANIGVGTHQLGIEVTTTSGAKSYTFRSVEIYPGQADAPVHRWLGTAGISRAFYVVDAAGRAWVWGDNGNGQLGLGFQSNPIIRPVMLPPPVGKQWRQFTSASYGAVGLTDDGAIYGMGKTALFPTQNPSVPLPLPMGGTRFARHAGLTQSTLWVINQWLELIPLLGPGIVSKGSFVDLDTGGYHVVALDRSGKLFYGPESDGFYSDFAIPGGDALLWVDISTCATHSLAVDSKGRLFGWGQNYSGQLPVVLGPNLTSPQLAPLPTGVTAWRKVVAGRLVSLAVDQNGRLFSWGADGYTGSAEPYVRSKITPVAVPANEADWLDIAVGASFAMALSARGNLYVWGDIPASPAPRHVDFPELVTGLPDLLNASAAASPVVTLEPGTIRLSPQFSVDLIAPAGSNLLIQTSPDLVNWTTVTNIPNAGPKTTFTAPLPNDGNMFIRAR